MLDSPGACIAELSEINVEIAGFWADWASAAGELRTDEKKAERLQRAAMRGTSGRNADERQAVAMAAVEEAAPGLLEEIEKLVGEVEDYKVRFKALERRASNAQSILSAMRAEAKFADYVAPGVAA